MNSNHQEKAIYAILADSAYWDVRYGINEKTQELDQPNSNWTPVPTDWQLIHEVSKSGGGINWGSLTSGFTARAYQNSNFN